jgi:starvation-inducible outer membrane lipoprotein
MTKQITLEEALKLVSFYQLSGGSWHVLEVYGNVKGNVNGNVNGYVDGEIYGDVNGEIYGNVNGNVYGTINGREWKFIETPKNKLQRLIEDSGNQELIDTFNQMKNN